MCDECTWHHKTFLMELYWHLAIQLYCIPGPRSAVVSASDCGSEGLGLNPIRVMWDFYALAGSYPELGVLWAKWEGWNHSAELHPLHGCVFGGVALIT